MERINGLQMRRPQDFERLWKRTLQHARNSPAHYSQPWLLDSARAFDYFKKDMRKHTSYLRLNYYPVCEQKVAPASHGYEEPEGSWLGINKHTDAGVLTILRQYHDEPSSLQGMAARPKAMVLRRACKGSFDDQHWRHAAGMEQRSIPRADSQSAGQHKTKTIFCALLFQSCL